MAGGVTWSRLRELAAFRASNSLAISLFVGLDPATAPTSADARDEDQLALDEAHRTAVSSRGELSARSEGRPPVGFRADP